MTSRAILHIPHAELLALKPIDEWIKTFESDRFARTTPTEIVLPAVGLGGPSFKSEVHPYPHYLEPPRDEKKGTHVRPFHLLADWTKQVREINPEIRVWGLINPVYAFLAGEYTRLLDQHGMTLDDNMCITNSVIQKMTDTFIDELVDEANVDGVVFDLTDIYPQAGSNMVVGLQNTCFCSYCLSALEAEGFHEGTEVFVGPSNPFRLLLRVDEDGTSNIPPNLAWTPSHLAKMSLARGFVKADDARVEQDAELLLSYINARARVVAQSARRLGQRAREREKMTAIVLGDKYVDLTTMTDMQTLQRYEAAGEFWMPGIDREYVLRQQVRVCVYLWGGATYSINAFFDTFEKADTILALQGVEEFLRRLLDRSKRLLGNTLTPGNVFTAKLAEEFQGFVGIPLGQKDHEQLVNLLSQRATGTILPPEILEQFRITNPTGSVER